MALLMALVSSVTGAGQPCPVSKDSERARLTAVALGTKVPDVPENRVVFLVGPGSNALVFDLLVPVGRSRRSRCRRGQQQAGKGAHQEDGRQKEMSRNNDGASSEELGLIELMLRSKRDDRVRNEAEAGGWKKMGEEERRVSKRTKQEK